jgi:hypothetical protein
VARLGGAVAASKEPPELWRKDPRRWSLPGARRARQGPLPVSWRAIHRPKDQGWSRLGSRRRSAGDGRFIANNEPNRRTTRALRAERSALAHCSRRHLLRASHRIHRHEPFSTATHATHSFEIGPSPRTKHGRMSELSVAPNGQTGAASANSRATPRACLRPPRPWTHWRTQTGVFVLRADRRKLV